MTFNLFTKKLLCLIICSFAALFSLAGCSQHDYRAEADKTVYNIIDQKWQDDFGSRANYRISDVAPSPNDIKIEKVIPPSGILTLPQAVAIATAHNRQYQLEKEILYTTALDLTLFRHELEPWFFSGAREGYGKEGSTEGVGGEADFGFQLLLASGARIGTKVGIAWFKVLTGDIHGGLASILSATLTQPLLRGSDQKVVMENLTQAERNTLYQLRIFNRFRKTFVVSVISSYYRVLELNKFVKNAENNYRVLSDVYEQVQKLTDAGRVPLFELDRVYQEKLQARDTLIQRQKEYKQALDEFKFWQLSLPTDTELALHENELEALSIAGLSEPDFSKIQEAKTEQAKEDLTDEALNLLEKELELIELIKSDATGSRTQDAYVQLEEVHQQVLDKLEINTGSPANINLQSSREKRGFSETDAVETALVLRLDLANKADAIYDAVRKVQVAADGLGTDLNLIAGTGIPSRDLSTSEMKQVGDTFIVDLELNLPLDRLAERNIYRKALIILNQRQREYEEMVDWVTLEIRQAYRDLTKAAERHCVQLESLELAQKRFDNTFLLLQYGRANSRRVLNAQADLFRAQNAATEALVGHTVAMLNFYRDAGVLAVRPDGMWEH